MRLHHLSITAFGPFPGTVEVDFDELAAGGVFLLTGATGAGKTSVLDAVCFALYGQVPGDRAGAKHLRCDVAPEDREPRVVLELSIGARRFRFTRSPAWSRPKRRGAGFTAAPAHVVIEERRGESWSPLTNRLDDAGLLVGDLLGMNCTQFTQVAMLPQGRFQAFLRATSAERHDVLQKLFRTDRFERIERWLVDQRVQSRRAADAAGTRVQEVLTRLQESSASTLPDGWADELGAAGDDGRIGAWTLSLSESAAVVAAEAARALTEAEDHELGTREALGDVRRLVALRERGTAARRALADHAAQSDERAAVARRLNRSRRAAPLDALVLRADAAAAAAHQAGAQWRHTVASLRSALDLPDDPDRATLLDRRSVAAARHAAAEAFRPRERDLLELRDRLRGVRGDLTAVEDQLARARAEVEQLPAALESAEKQRKATVVAVRNVAPLRAHVSRLEALLAAATRETAAGQELALAREELSRATEHAQSTRETYLDVREARINGMAAELAGKLAVGCGCPVCGSAEHPAPAQRSASSVTRDDEAGARRLHEDAVIAEVGHQAKVAGLEIEVAALAEQLGGIDRAELPGQVAAGRERLEQTEAEAATEQDATLNVATLRTALADARERAAALDARAASLRKESAEREVGIATLDAERTALFGEDPRDLEDLIAHRASEIISLDGALADLDAALAAAARAESAAAAVEEAAIAAGFSDAAEASRALIPAREAAALEESLAAAEATRAGAENTLADPEVQDAEHTEPLDPGAAHAAHQEALRAVRAAAARREAARTRLQRIGELDAVLVDALQAWEPLRAEHRMIADLASLAEGRSVDNPLRMRLAAFVLAERLRQVVAAANERLHGMTDGRFALEHVLDRGAGEQRGGLSLRIRDDWSGVDRDPATLSGGETFVVSLALALGLADTVAHEAGGTDIDTLFIDEGFGSLDADTLEDVMDTLDALRDGGRVVGLVSHVPELRSRITAQLEVIKGRSGSTVRPRVAAG